MTRNTRRELSRRRRRWTKVRREQHAVQTYLRVTGAMFDEITLRRTRRQHRARRFRDDLFVNRTRKRTPESIAPTTHDRNLPRPLLVHGIFLSGKKALFIAFGLGHQ